MLCAVPLPAPCSRAGRDNSTRGVPIALTPRRPNLRVVLPIFSWPAANDVR
jgi:hypothetical protein